MNNSAIFSGGAGFGVDYGNNLWVAVGYGANSIAYSSNGFSWTGLGSGVSIYDPVTYNLITRLWYTGSIYSVNGTQWFGLGISIYGISKTTSNIINKQSFTIAYSSNITGWTAVPTTIFSNNVSGIATNGYNYVISGSNPTNTLGYSSNNLTLWTSLGTTIFSTIANNVYYSGRNYYAMGTGTNVLVSSRDGQTWSGISQNIITNGFGFAFVNNSALSPIAIGSHAGYQNQGTYSISIGYQAGQTNQGSYSLSIGYQTGGLATGSIAIGYQSGYTSLSTETNKLSIGYQSGYSGQKIYSTAIGYQSGQINQNSNSIAIGYQSGQINQNSSSIAIGYQSGQTNQNSSSIAIGYQSGQISQGSLSIAIGYQAGQNYQSQQAIAIGYQSGQINQGSGSIAIGYQAGQNTQGSGSIAIGYQTSMTNQSSSSVSIGNYIDRQQPNSVVINSSQTNLDGLSVGTFINSIRFDNSKYLSNISYSISKEFVYNNNSNSTIIENTFKENKKLNSIPYNSKVSIKTSSVISTISKNVSVNSNQIYTFGPSIEPLWISGGKGLNTLNISQSNNSWFGLGNTIFSSSCNGIIWNGNLWVAVG